MEIDMPMSRIVFPMPASRRNLAHATPKLALQTTGPCRALMVLGPMQRGWGFTLGEALCSELLRLGQVCAARFELTPVRSAEMTDLDSVSLDIETDGTLSPRQALHLASGRLTRYAEALVSLGGSPDAVGLRNADPPTPVPVERLALAVRTIVALRVAGVLTVEDLILRSEVELLALPRLGRKGMAEVRDALAERGLLLAPASRRRPPQQ